MLLFFYRVLSVGVPVPSEGAIDIPITEKEVQGSQPHYKVSLSSPAGHTRYDILYLTQFEDELPKT